MALHIPACLAAPEPRRNQTHHGPRERGIWHNGRHLCKVLPLFAVHRVAAGSAVMHHALAVLQRKTKSHVVYKCRPWQGLRRWGTAAFKSTQNFETRRPGRATSLYNQNMELGILRSNFCYPIIIPSRTTNYSNPRCRWCKRCSGDHSNA